ncbi:MAG: hypothetical protein M1383_06190 [Patescibacteria group bacterium]|nr:hypothetical protein [Patescibacteria group bacterium]
MKNILFKAHNIKGENRNCVVCGNKFWAYRYRIKQGRGKVCSHECANKYQLGQHHSQKTEFKIGNIPAKREYPRGISHPNWMGQKVGYFALHLWVTKWRGKPKKCEHCGLEGKKVGRRWNIEWANIDRKYRRCLKDFIALCKSCHTIYDNNLIRQCG